MNKKVFITLLLALVLVSGRAVSQNDWKQMLHNAKSAADDAKKNTPKGKPETGLPKGYDNSWKIKISFTRSVSSNTSIGSPNDGCPETKTGSGEYLIKGDISTDTAVGYTNGEDFSLWTDRSGILRTYEKPFKGMCKLEASNKEEGKSCNGSGTANWTAQASIPARQLTFRFDYNKKEKKGDFMIFIDGDYILTASGESVSSEKGNPTQTTDLSQPAKSQTKLMTDNYGRFQAYNYAVSDDPNIQQALNATPINSGQATIHRTKYGYDISYTETKTVNNPIPERWSGTDDLIYNTNVHVSITNQNPPEFDAIIEPVDENAYKNYIPEGPKVDGSNTEGNSLSFVVKIIDKKSGKDITSLHPFTVTYTLSDVSKYKGICMNYPQKNADTKADLRWGSNTKSESNLKSCTDDQLVSVEGEGKNLPAFVTSYDYAAYGVLKAHVHLVADDIDLDAHPKGKPEEPYVTIPIDENHNKIADKWEKDMGVYGIGDPTWDEDDLPTQQRRNGDGYTIFEEYRGFKVNDNLIPKGCKATCTNHHVRTDPHYKDIFIDDEDGLFKRYAAPYNPSDLCWHYIDKTEMIFTADGSDPKNRWVNFNEVEAYFYAKQYALILVDKPAEKGGGVLGQQMDYSNVKDYDSHAGPGLLDRFKKLLREYFVESIPEKSFGFDQAVKHTIIIDVYTSEITRQSKFFPQDKQQGIYDILITGVINHEMGHAIGITHHRLESGKETDSSKIEGVTNCCMRYLSNSETAAKFLIPTTPYYCHKNDTWKQILPMTEDQKQSHDAVPVATATRHSNNCYGQIDIKSDP